MTFGGRDWNSSPGLAAQMFAAFGVMRQLNELRWHLVQASGLLSPGGPAGSLSAIGALREELSGALRAAQGYASGTPEMLTNLDIDGHRDAVSELLRRISAAVRSAFAAGGQDLRGADLAGADLRTTAHRGVELRGASLRGALLIGADLRGADLAWADLTGADLRGARVGGADLSGALFLSRNQAGSANGDARTRLPAALPRPAHWA